MLNVVFALLLGLLVGLAIGHVFLSKRHHGSGLKWQGSEAYRRNVSRWLLWLASSIAPAGDGKVSTGSFAAEAPDPASAAPTSFTSAQAAEAFASRDGDLHGIQGTGPMLEQSLGTSERIAHATQMATPASMVATANGLQDEDTDSMRTLRPPAGHEVLESPRHASDQLESSPTFSRGLTFMQQARPARSQRSTKAEVMAVQSGAEQQNDALSLALSQPGASGPSLLQLHGKTAEQCWQVTQVQQAPMPTSDLHMQQQLPASAAPPSVTIQLDDKAADNDKQTAPCRSPFHPLASSNLAVATPPRAPPCGLKRQGSRSHSADPHGLTVIAAANRRVDSLMCSASSSPVHQLAYLESSSTLGLRTSRSVASSKALDAVLPIPAHLAFMLGPQSAPQLQGRGCTSPTRMQSHRPSARRSVEQSPTMAQLPIYTSSSSALLCPPQPSSPSMQDMCAGANTTAASTSQVATLSMTDGNGSGRRRPKPCSAAHLTSSPSQPMVVQRSRLSAEHSPVPPLPPTAGQSGPHGNSRQPSTAQISSNSSVQSGGNSQPFSSGSNNSMLRPGINKLRPGVSWGEVLHMQDDGPRGGLESMLSSASSTYNRRMLSEQYATIMLPSMAGMVEPEDMSTLPEDMLSALLQQHIGQQPPSSPRMIPASQGMTQGDAGLSAFSFSPTARAQQDELAARASRTPDNYQLTETAEQLDELPRKGLWVNTVKSARWEQAGCESPTITPLPSTATAAMASPYVQIPEDLAPGVARVRRPPKAHRSFYQAKPGASKRNSVDFTSSPRRASALCIGTPGVMVRDRSSCPNVQRTRTTDAAVHGTVLEPEVPAPSTYEIMAVAFGWHVPEDEALSDDSHGPSDELQQLAARAVQESSGSTIGDDAGTAAPVPDSPEGDSQQEQEAAEMVANTWRSLPHSNIEQLGLDYLTRNSRSSAGQTPTKRQAYPKSCPSGAGAARASVAGRRTAQDERPEQPDEARHYGNAPRSSSMAARSALRFSIPGESFEESNSAEALLKVLGAHGQSKPAYVRHGSLLDPAVRSSRRSMDQVVMMRFAQLHVHSDDGHATASAGTAVPSGAALAAAPLESAEQEVRGLIRCPTHTRFRAAKSVKFLSDEKCDDGGTAEPPGKDGGNGGRGDCTANLMFLQQISDDNMPTGASGSSLEQRTAGPGSEACSPFGKYTLTDGGALQNMVHLEAPKEATHSPQRQAPLRRSSSQSLGHPPGVLKQGKSHRRHSSIMFSDQRESETAQLGSVMNSTSVGTVRYSLPYSSSRPSDSRSSRTAASRSRRPSATPSRASSMHRRKKSSSGTNVHSPGAESRRFMHTTTSGRDRLCKVLLVATDSQKIQAVHAALPDKRYNIVHASSADCVRMLATSNSRHLPDVILVDCSLGQRRLSVSLGISKGRLHTLFQDTPMKSKTSSIESTEALLGSSGSRRLPRVTSQRPSSSMLADIMAADSSGLPEGDDYDGGDDDLTDLTALELIHEIRESHDPSSLPVIMLTGPGPRFTPVASTCPIHGHNDNSNNSSSSPGMLMTGSSGSAGSSPAELCTCMDITLSSTRTPGTSMDALLPISPAVAAGVEALKKGANDYVVLPVVSIELEARISMQVALRRAMRLKAEVSSSMMLLRSILPDHVIKKLKMGERYIAQYHKEVSIAFIDIVQFTQMSANWPSGKVAAMLNSLFSRFDDICERHGVYHVDTIGDGYMVLCGHCGEQDHALKLVRAAVEMLECSAQPITCGHDEKGQPDTERVRLRVGINSGPAHSGVLGTKRFKYTVWGDSVNGASRMESSGFPGCIQVSSATYHSCMSSMKAYRETASRAGSPGRAARALDTAGSERPSADCSIFTAATTATHFSHSPIGSSPRWGVDSPSTSVASGAERGSVGEQSSHTGWLGTPRSSDVGEALEFEFVSLGLREIKGKGLMATFLVQVGDWQAGQQACAATQQNWQMPHASAVSPGSNNTALAVSDWTCHAHSPSTVAASPQAVSQPLPGAWSSNVALWHVSGPSSPAEATLHGSAASAPAQMQAASQPLPRLVLPHSPAGQHNSADAVHSMSIQQQLQRPGTRTSPASTSHFYSAASSVPPLSLGPFGQQGVRALPSKRSVRDVMSGTPGLNPNQRVPSQRRLPGFDAAYDSTMSQDLDDFTSPSLYRSSTYYRDSTIDSNNCNESTLCSTFCHDSTVCRDSADRTDAQPAQPGAPWGVSVGSSRSSQPLSSHARSSRLANSSHSSHSSPVDKTSGKSAQVSSEALRALRSQGDLVGGTRAPNMLEQLEAQLRALLGPHCLDNVHPGKRAALVSWMEEQMMGRAAQYGYAAASSAPDVQFKQRPVSEGNAPSATLGSQAVPGLAGPVNGAVSAGIHPISAGHVMRGTSVSQGVRQADGSASQFQGCMAGMSGNPVPQREKEAVLMQLQPSRSHETAVPVLDVTAVMAAADQFIAAQLPPGSQVALPQSVSACSHMSASSAVRFKTATSETTSSGHHSSGTHAGSSTRQSGNPAEGSTPKRERMSKSLISGPFKSRSGSQLSVLRTMSKLCKETVEKLTSSFSLSPGSSNQGPPASDRRRAVSFCAAVAGATSSQGVQPGNVSLMNRSAQSSNGAYGNSSDNAAVKPRAVSTSYAGQGPLTGARPSNLSLPLRSALLDMRPLPNMSSAKSYSGVCTSGGSGTALQYRLTPQGTLEPSSSTKSDQQLSQSMVQTSTQINAAPYLYFTSSSSAPGEPTGSWTAGRPSALNDKPQTDPAGTFAVGRPSLLSDKASKASLPLPELQETKAVLAWEEPIDDRARTVTLPTMHSVVSRHHIGVAKASSARNLSQTNVSTLLGVGAPKSTSANNSEFGAARSEGRSHDGSQGSSVTSKGSQFKGMKRMLELFKGRKGSKGKQGL